MHQMDQNPAEAKRLSSFVRIGRGDSLSSSLDDEEDDMDDDQAVDKRSFVRIGRIPSSAFVRIGRDRSGGYGSDAYDAFDR